MKIAAPILVLAAAGLVFGNPAAHAAGPMPALKAGDWLIEQMPGGTVTVQDDGIDIRDRDGCTVWFRRELTAPVEIAYEAMVVSEGKPGERVSDLNCFWMATDPRSQKDFFAAKPARTGKFADYDALKTYYVGYGGNGNTTTRFRRYAGDGTRPLLPENDRGGAAFLLEPNRWYRLKLEARDGVARFSRNDEMVFEFHDQQFLERGWFGFRTVSSHLRFRKIRISSPTASLP